MSELKDILEFQTEKRIYKISTTSLQQLEKFRDYCLVLEKIMENAGFEDKEYKQALDLFKLCRKAILDETGDNNREIQEFMKKFDIKLKS